MRGFRLGGLSITVDNDGKLKKSYRGGALQSSTTCLETRRPDRKPFHILTTKFLEGNDVLVYFSDGSAAIFEAEELEKLRPIPKQILATAPVDAAIPAPLEPVLTVPSTPERDRSLVLGSAVA
jgi:hypothetical protein